MKVAVVSEYKPDDGRVDATPSDVAALNGDGYELLAGCRALADTTESRACRHAESGR